MFSPTGGSRSCIDAGGSPTQLGARMSPEQLPHLETFARAAELSSFTGAARALGLTQAAVSQRIAALEKFLGVPLFRRQGGHVLLTDAGRRLYDFAQRILALHGEAIAELAGRPAAPTGDLVLAASSVPGEHFLPELLAAYRAKHPHIQVRVTVSDTRAVLHEVEQGQAHLGLVGGKEDRPHLEFRRFATDQLLLVVGAAHPWKRRRRVRLAQLAVEPLLVREPGSASRACLEHALVAAGTSLSAMRVGLELGSNEALKEAVQRGLGVAVLSTHVVRHEVENGPLHAVEIADLSLEREMFVVWDRRRVLPIPARLFLDVVDVPA
jgi:DNA-binding transcriptional LysR family regulator